MRRKLALTLFVVGIGAVLFGWLRGRIHRPPPQPPTPPPEMDDRVAVARLRTGEKVRALFQAAGFAGPPREIFLRAFKHESQLELWAREDDGPMRLVTTYHALAPSGGPGPKRREGDRQVPEGFYVIDRFNPRSHYHLSLGLDYPNASDRVRSDRDQPGSDIFIHGSDRTIGCLPLGDPAIEELYLIALDARDRGQRTIHVHIFPARMGGPEWDKFAPQHIARDAALAPFWEELRPGFLAFESTHRVPVVEVEADGSYKITPQG